MDTHEFRPDHIIRIIIHRDLILTIIIIMVELVINYSKEKQTFLIYEPTTDTLIASTNLTEALVNVSSFLTKEGLITGNILDYPDISYHIDSMTMKAMVDSNVALLKRLNTAPSGFQISTQRFGGSNLPTKKEKDWKASKKTKQGFGKSSSTFSRSNFNSSYRKFGERK